jgi:phosphohistidine phosphatase
MTRRLILMRHAKSSWDDPFLPDHERPLNARGVNSAKALGNWLRTHQLVPDEVISSTSTRTMQTAEGLALAPPVRFTKALYHADPAQIWQVLSQATGQCVLILGHNPGIAEFAAQCVTQPPDHPRFDDYPTGATLVVDFDAPAWDMVRPGTGRTAHFVIPRELLT